jgi:hypothetical protein
MRCKGPLLGRVVRVRARRRAHAKGDAASPGVACLPSRAARTSALNAPSSAMRSSRVLPPLAPALGCGPAPKPPLGGDALSGPPRATGLSNSMRSISPSKPWATSACVKPRQQGRGRVRRASPIHANRQRTNAPMRQCINAHCAFCFFLGDMFVCSVLCRSTAVVWNVEGAPPSPGRQGASRRTPGAAAGVLLPCRGAALGSVEQLGTRHRGWGFRATQLNVTPAHAGPPTPAKPTVRSPVWP